RSLSIETRSPPGLLAPTLAAFTLITRTARACASYPSCVAVYPRDSRSRRVLCRSSRSLHSYFLILRFRRNHRRQDAANALDHGFTSNLKHRTSNIPNVGSWLLL